MTRILGPRPDLAYHDVRSVELPATLTPLDAWNLMMSDRLPLIGAAFWLRDAISSLFGVKKIGGFTGQKAETVKPGDRLDFFLVEAVEPGLLVLTERDVHLDVMTSVSTDDKVLTITSSVITHNLFGRLYMLPVGIAHKLIVNAMLGRLKRRLTRAQM